MNQSLEALIKRRASEFHDKRDNAGRAFYAGATDETIRKVIALQERLNVLREVMEALEDWTFADGKTFADFFDPAEAELIELLTKETKHVE